MLKLLQAIYDLGFQTSDDQGSWCFYCSAEFRETEAHAAAMKRNMRRMADENYPTDVEDWWEIVEPTDEIEHEPDCLYLEMERLWNLKSSTAG